MHCTLRTRAVSISSITRHFCGSGSTNAARLYANTRRAARAISEIRAMADYNIAAPNGNPRRSKRG